MNLENVNKINSRKAKRVGRGQGSGKGKTSGRGTKGQNARGKLSITHQHYEGGQRPLIKRLPYRRGKGNWKTPRRSLAVNVEALNLLPQTVKIVDLEALIQNKIVAKSDANFYGIKILGQGTVTRSFEIKLPISKSAAAKIEKAGGKVTK